MIGDRPDSTPELAGTGLFLEAQGMFDAAAEARDYAERIRVKQSDINDDVKNLRISWTGPAAKSYEKDWDEVQESSKSVIAELEAIADLIESAAREYLETEDGNKSGFDTVGEQISGEYSRPSEYDSKRLNL